MTLQDYFSGKPRGSKAALARDLGITKTWLSLIISGRALPSANLCLEIERRTGVSRSTLRPDLFGGVL
jgi:DNA-binding transcriptional regulator YdaS (Cro superfamily)